MTSMKKIKIIAKITVTIIPLILYWVLLKIMPEIGGNGPQVYERQVMRLLIPCMLYSLEYILASLAYLVKTIMAFEDKINLKWFKFANMVKCMVLSAVSIAITRHILFDVLSRKIGEKVLCCFVLLLAIIESMFILCEYWTKCKRGRT